MPRVLLVELIHQPNLCFCWETYNLPVSNFWLIITWSHPSETKWWKIPVGKASKVFHLTAAVCQLVCPLHPFLSTGSMDITRQSQLPADQMQSQHSQQHVTLSHLSIDWHWASVWSKCSGTSPVSLIQEMGTWTLRCMTHSKAACGKGKCWVSGLLFLGLGERQEGKYHRKLNYIHCWAALRGLLMTELKYFALAT